MKIIGLDVHRDWTQLAVIAEDGGEVLLEMKVETKVEHLRRAIEGIRGRKKVVFEEGNMSGMIYDAIKDIADEVVSSDSTRNALICRSEDSNDERDAKRLARLMRLGEIKKVYVAPEGYRVLRSLVHYDYMIAGEIIALKNQIKGLCRRCGIKYRGIRAFNSRFREEVLSRISDDGFRYQLRSLYTRLEGMRRERINLQKMIRRKSRGMEETEKIKKIPGIGNKLAPVICAWIVDPGRFKSRKAVSSYAGLGIGQGYTNWLPVGHARASKRGNRELKRALFLAARCAVRGDNALARRYAARIESGWPDRKAIRDIARSILYIVIGIWKVKGGYKEKRVRIPD